MEESLESVSLPVFSSCIPLQRYVGGGASLHRGEKEKVDKVQEGHTIAAVQKGIPSELEASNPPSLPHPACSAFSGRTIAKSPRTLAYSANDPIPSNLPPWTKAATLVPSFRSGYLEEVLTTVPERSQPSREPSGASQALCFQSVGFWAGQHNVEARRAQRDETRCAWRRGKGAWRSEKVDKGKEEKEEKEEMDGWY